MSHDYLHEAKTQLDHAQTDSDIMHAIAAAMIAIVENLYPKGPDCTCPETDPDFRDSAYTVASSDLEPHARTCPRWGMKRAERR